ncbi:MAG: HEAT repeat domain-containing protein [Candidatus Marinimicrobia bacterium]|nr:HEAT repeat domain-containing protein [Candidatus Neomarinimicrobiota bacterium]
MKSYFKKLSSADPRIISEGIEELEAELKIDPGEEELSLMFDALSSLFYVDTFDRPDLRTVRDEAQRVIASMGPKAIPLILARLENTDLKAELVFAQTCGLMGDKAISTLIESYDQRREAIFRSFILYAFGKIRSAKIVDALPIVLQAVKSPSRELEDTAVRALGKICESIDPGDVNAEMKEEIFYALSKKLTHPNDVIRSKAVRSLGKLVRFGFTDNLQNDYLRSKISDILGLEEGQTWDFAYLVRREAQEVRKYLGK